MTPFESIRTHCDRRSFLGHSLAGLSNFALAILFPPARFAGTKIE
jgi:hypothetical protein